MRPAPYVPDFSQREMWVLKKCAFAVVVILSACSSRVASSSSSLRT